eukprot:TRINITY_DN998_c0_g1_i1.p1 TRINITY_DN998_c0_g1~~TRINITY_DN998_c0_g1_i1.p1  ORF type:complete len:193 (-),score=36.12 TRINITY_DN998_c0_g1_i1:287-865(-)
MSKTRSRSNSTSFCEGDNDIEGFLFKRGGFIKNWKKRWFELKYGVLRYYKYSLGKKKLIKSLYLGATKSCGVCKDEQLPDGAPSDNCFVLEYLPHNRTYYFCAKTEGEMQLWVSKIQMYIHSDSPKNQKDYNRKVVEHTTLSSNNFETSIDSESESESWGNIFEANKMRMSFIPHVSPNNNDNNNNLINIDI